MTYDQINPILAIMTDLGDNEAVLMERHRNTVPPWCQCAGHVPRFPCPGLSTRLALSGARG